jgi:dihydrodipicolinate synthase/N-acetylneuraminate lyase
MDKVADKCAAWLTGISNFSPKIEIDFYNYYLNNNKEKCNEIINNIEKPYFHIKDNLSWHLGIKSTLHLLGIMDRQERMPYKQLNKKQHQQVKDILIKLTKIKSNQKYIQKKNII